VSFTNEGFKKRRLELDALYSEASLKVKLELVELLLFLNFGACLLGFFLDLEDHDEDNKKRRLELELELELEELFDWFGLIFRRSLISRRQNLKKAAALQAQASLLRRLQNIRRQAQAAVF
jgi:hypothetical protein